MRTVQQLRQQLETQAETIQRLNIENRHLGRRLETLQGIVDRLREIEDRNGTHISQAWDEAERYFTQ